MSRYDWPSVARGAEERDDPATRARWVARRRTDFDPEGARQAALAAVEPAPEPDARPGRRGRRPRAPATGLEHLWQPLGPATVVGGQAVGLPRIAGRVNAIAVHPDGQRLYAASANGGVWYSGDAGATWQSLGGFAATPAPRVTRPAQRNACGAIRVVFGATAADDDVYVGTGEVSHPMDAQPGSSLGGVGILFAHGPAASGADDPWRREAPNLVGEGVARIAVEPGGTRVVAATTVGLFERPAAPGVDVDWTRVTGAPFADLGRQCTDVLWTAGAGARPARLWVWVRSGDQAGLWVRAAGATDFTKVETPGSQPGVAVLAASTPPDQLWVFNDAGETARNLLYRVAAAGAAAPVATRVTGVPDVLHDQGFYDIAAAVHPTQPNRIVLGGSVFSFTAPDDTVLEDGAVVVGDVGTVGGALAFQNATMLGVGVHSDVHDLAWSNGGARLWASCDGGVFRSDHPTKAVGFVPCNDGLSVIESNYLAHHPVCEGHVVAGLQDNGVVARASGGVWLHVGDGDGGGILLDPLRPDRFLRQHYGGLWSSSDGSVAAKAMLRRGKIFAKTEHKASAFYSAPAAIAHRRVSVAPAPPDVGQILVGTTRVWYTDDFGASWATLPTGTDPLPADKDFLQDAFGEPVTVCRWQSPDVAWILGEGTLKRYARTPGSDAAGGPGTWTATTLLARRALEKKDPLAALRPLFDATVWTDVAPNLEPPAVADGLPTVRGTLGALYLGTIGEASDAAVDTLWWFDGTDKWHPTGLRNHPRGVPAPVTAIACDPARPNEVWVGTTVGVWYGERTLGAAGAAPAWEWWPRVNGLPEAAVEDLALFGDGGLRLLRAAIAARGVWELRLDVTDLQELTYLRAHDDDLRHRDTAIERPRTVAAPSTATVPAGTPVRSWHGSPDVRPRVAPRAIAAPAALQLTRAAPGDPERLRRFQAALRARTNDPRVRATGRWDDYFNEVLRDLGAPILPAPHPHDTVGIDKAFWDRSMTGAHATAEPWSTPRPSEADLYDVTAELSEGEVGKASCTMPRAPLRVDVLVHHRGREPVDGATVRVTLLRWMDPRTRGAARWDDSARWPATDVPWTAAVNQVLSSTDGKTTHPDAPGWRFVVGDAGTSRRLTLAGQTIDATRAGVATFDLDISTFRRDRVVLLVAIIRVGAAAALDPAPLRELALGRPDVAVRSLRVAP